MGYRDPNTLEAEAEYWDDVLRDFGPAVYVEWRYLSCVGAVEKEG